jgi:hypothetical protein
MRHTAPLFLALLSLALLPIGCSKPTRQGTEPLSSPAEGYVRLIPAKVKETVDTVHYQWSLLGERNWTTPSVSGGKATLAGVYKLNDPKNYGGCPTWLCDVIFTKQANDWKWELRLHGSNGKTATETGTAAGTPEILAPKDTDLPLSTEASLAKLGEKTFTLSAPKS